MAVHFRFTSEKAFESVSIYGTMVSVADLKDLIIAQKKLTKSPKDFFGVVILDAKTNEEYTDDASFVPRNTSMLVRRIPRPSFVIAAKSLAPSAAVLRNMSKQAPALYQGSAFATKVVPAPTDNDDDFGSDVYAPSAPFKSCQENKENEDEKIKALVEADTIEWQRRPAERAAPQKAYGNNCLGRNLVWQREYVQGFEKKIPHAGYVCHRCGVVGHFIQHCPTNGDQAYDKKKIRLPTGIPKIMLDIAPEGTYFLPTGEVAVMKPNESAFESGVDFLPSSARQINDIPAELQCPLCKEVLKDAVFASKCCFRSYCDKCIRNQIISQAKCACGATNVLADNLLPNISLRGAICLLLNSSQSSCITSSDNAGNRAHAPDVDSKLSSVAVSAAVVGSDISDRTKGLGARGKRNVETKQAPMQIDDDDDDSVESALLTQEDCVQQPAKGMKTAGAKRVRQDMVYGMQYAANKAQRRVY